MARPGPALPMNMELARFSGWCCGFRSTLTLGYMVKSLAPISEEEKRNALQRALGSMRYPGVCLSCP